MVSGPCVSCVFPNGGGQSCSVMVYRMNDDDGASPLPPEQHCFELPANSGNYCIQLRPLWSTFRGYVVFTLSDGRTVTRPLNPVDLYEVAR